MFVLSSEGRLVVYNRGGGMTDYFDLIRAVTLALQAMGRGTGIWELHLWPVRRGSLADLLQTAQDCKKYNNSSPTLEAALQTDPDVLNLIALASVPVNPLLAMITTITTILNRADTVFLLLPMFVAERPPLPPPPPPCVIRVI